MMKGMQFVPYAEAELKAPIPSCKVMEYPLNDSDLDIATAILTGRYPESGWALNEECKEMGYVLSGSGMLVTEEKSVQVTVGDVIVLDAGEKYYWNGNMTVLLITNPPWFLEQHKHVQDEDTLPLR